MKPGLLITAPWSGLQAISIRLQYPLHLTDEDQVMQAPPLKGVLVANALFCSINALLFLFLPALIAEYVIDLPSFVFMLLGGGLLIFAVDVYHTSRKPVPSRGKLMYIFFADLGWVFMTPVMMFVLSDRLTGLGNLLLLDIAIIVTVFAYLEWLGIHKLKHSHVER